MELVGNFSVMKKFFSLSIITLFIIFLVADHALAKKNRHWQSCMQIISEDNFKLPNTDNKYTNPEEASNFCECWSSRKNGKTPPNSLERMRVCEKEYFSNYYSQ